MPTNRLIHIYGKSRNRLVKKFCKYIVRLFGCVIGDGAVIADNVNFVHGGLGCVIYSNTVIENDVRIYQNVTIGKADIVSTAPAHIIIHRGAILCAGAKILCHSNTSLEIGENAIIAANAVVLCSVPKNEIWGGIPAHKLKLRNDITSPNN